MTIEQNSYFNVSEKIVSNAERLIDFDVQMYVDDPRLIINRKFNGCLAFVKFVLLDSGINIPDYIGPDNIIRRIKFVNEMFDHFGILVEYGQQQKGDILCFSRRGERPQHIGIVVDNSYYIHAPARKGVVCKDKIEILPIENIGLNPIYKNNPIGFKRATMPTDHPRWFQKPI